ncbi:MAG TPA: TRAP transporter large permease subunit [Rhodopila sp.]|uniref:TRAP transporter large permease n=1 Tax=Rhodopila sp. TaxID=2480087 RepID=UPI002D09D37C|nr:TRAP transporter large permease subunit [Rhodopila sp.]HVY15763.1 TRAP transporter large permease subunit [Rhodopila sp.]
MQIATDRIPIAEPSAALAQSRVLDRWLGHLLCAACVLLLSAEIVLLLIGVVARYAFGAPQVWIDELTSMLFLWLAMLGAVLALRGGSHMRMTALIGRARGPVWEGLNTLSVAAPAVFLLFTLRPALRYVQNEQIVSLTTMDISMAWRAAAMPVGIGLMLLSLLLRLRRPTLPEAVAFAALLALATTMTVWDAGFRTLGNLNLLVFFVGVAAATVLAGIPIAFSFGLSTLAYLALTTHIPLSVLLSRMDAGMSHPVLLAVPLFIFLGLLIEMTGMAAVIVAFLSNLLGHVRGGLSYVLIAAMYLVSGISGSKAADMAAIAPALFPEMVKRGVPRGELVALLAATGSQTETIPPSLILITIGSVTGISIAALFAGGVIPGVAGGLFLGVVVWLRARRSGSVAPRASRAVILRSLVISLPALALPFVIRAAIVDGVATATEVSTIGIVYACVAGLLIYRRFEWARLWPMLVQTASLSGAILLIVGAATAMAWAITQSGFSRGLETWIVGMPGGAASFLAVSALIFVVLGSVLEGIPAIVLMGPILFPIAHRLGLNEVHYAVTAVLAMGIGLFSPPFGVGYYVACAIGACDPEAGLPYIGRYILALFVGLVVVAAVPWLTTIAL